MHLSARKAVHLGDKGWEGYVDFIGLPKLAQIRTIDLGLNEIVEGTEVQSWCTLDQVWNLLADLPVITSKDYYQLAVDLSEEPVVDSGSGLTLLGYDMSDETWTSSLLNCGKWTGPLEKFEQELNEFGLLNHEHACRAQELLPEVWGEDNPHAFVDLWQLLEVDPSLRPDR